MLLERLARLDATLVDALVDSRKTQALGIPEAERRLITEPVQLALVADMEALRVRMGTAQAKIAQEPDATKGGNSTKRVRLRLDVPGYGPDQTQRIADILSVPLREAGAPRVLLDRLESADDERPTEDDFAAAVAALDALDKAGHRALRVEQSYLRKGLFKGSTAPCDLCGRVFEVELLVTAHIKKRADCDDQEKRDVAHVVMSRVSVRLRRAVRARLYSGRRRRPGHPQSCDRGLGARPWLRATAPQGQVLWPANDGPR